jgi:uncharacterized protein
MASRPFLATSIGAIPANLTFSIPRINAGIHGQNRTSPANLSIMNMLFRPSPTVDRESRGVRSIGTPIRMDTLTALILTAAFLAAAFLYGSVGQAGATAYLTAMALAGMAPAPMRPTALVLNVLVASIASYTFYRSGAFSWRLFWPFAAASVPAAYLGGTITLPGDVYRIVLGLILLYAAVRMFRTSGTMSRIEPRTVQVVPALAVGAGVGLLSGLTGTGGGIFLMPVLLFAGWATHRQAAAVSAVFILVNSLAGLAGQAADLGMLPSAMPVWLAAVAIGGWAGAQLGSRHWSGAQARKALALVIAIAAIRMMIQL